MFAEFFLRPRLAALISAVVLSVCFGCQRTEAVPAEERAVAAAEEYEASWQSFHMGTLIAGKTFGKTPEEAKRLAELVESEIIRYDDMMSVHKETALNEVNRQAGRPVEVPFEVAEMTEAALRFADLTDGAFEPTIGPVVNLWKIGFGGDSVPSDAAIQEALKRVDHSSVRVFEKSGAWFVQIDEGQNIDMGAIAKGYIGQKLAEALKANGAKHALLDLGGNVVAVGSKAPGKPWRVGLQRPDQERGQYFAVVQADDVSVITSGAYERNFEKDGRRYGHILSAKTGRPAATDLSSVTIVDADGARADALCTALFGMGWNVARKFLDDHPDVHAVILKDDLKSALMSRALESKVAFADPAVQVLLY